MTVVPAAGAAGRAVDRLVLSGPDAFLASVPHMLGFECQDSVVLVGLGPDPDDPSDTGAMVRLVQRFDTPRADAPAAEVASIARSAAAPMARSGSTEVIVAVFGRSPSAGNALPCAVLVDDVLAAVDDAGLGVRDALFTDGTSRWSYGCTDPDCCPPQGRVIPDATRTRVAAEFAGVGAAMATSRAALAEEVAPDPDRVTAVASRADDLAAPRGDTSGLEGWRDRALEHLTALARTTGSAIDPMDAALALQGLADVRVRDTFLWDAAQPGTGTRVIAARLADLVRCAPPGLVAPVATVLAITQWTAGDGARANVALDRATVDDPDYSLAHLAGAALRSGLPPSTWAQSLAGLDRDTCRHGTQQPEARASTVRSLRPAPATAHPAVEAVVLGPSPGLAS